MINAAMPSASQRAEFLLFALREFPRVMGKVGEGDLLSLLACELGNEQALDDFVPRGKILAPEYLPGFREVPTPGRGYG